MSVSLLCQTAEGVNSISSEPTYGNDFHYQKSLMNFLDKFVPFDSADTERSGSVRPRVRGGTQR